MLPALLILLGVFMIVIVAAMLFLVFFQFVSNRAMKRSILVSYDASLSQDNLNSFPQKLTFPDVGNPCYSRHNCCHYHLCCKGM